MEYINELLVAIDEQVSYILVGAFFTFAALFIFRKIISMFIFVAIGLVVFAVIKLTILEPIATGDTTGGVIKKKIDRVKETIEGVKEMKGNVKEKVDEVKKAKDKIDKTIEKLKEKEKTEFEKLMQELEEK